MVLITRLIFFAHTGFVVCYDKLFSNFLCVNISRGVNGLTLEYYALCANKGLFRSLVVAASPFSYDQSLLHQTFYGCTDQGCFHRIILINLEINYTLSVRSPRITY